MSRRLRGTLQYDGTAYRGWQNQPDAVTIQGVCEAALEKVLGMAIPVVASGRTDTGVHAMGQVVHLHPDTDIEPDDLRRAWNAYLPADIWVERLDPAGDAFHARHDAIERTYRYFIAESERAESPFVSRYAWPLSRPVDWDAIDAATPLIVGVHDFRCFAKGVSNALSQTAVPPGECDVRGAAWTATPDGRALDVTANRFVRHMVRGIVGALIGIGRGRVAIDQLAAALAPEGQRISARYAPPQGLFLWAVRYEA